MADYTSVESSLTNTTSRGSFYNMLKDQYLPKLNDWINQGFGGEHRVATDLMKKRGGMIGGRRSVAAAFTGNPQSVEFGVEGQMLPIASSSTAVQLDIISRTLRYRLAFTEESQTAAKMGNAAAWAAPKAAELELARKQLEINVARNLHHGRYHPLGQLSSSSTGTSLVFLSPNARRSTAAAFYALGTKHVRNNQAVQATRVGDGLGGAPRYTIDTFSGSTANGRDTLSSVSDLLSGAWTATVSTDLAGASRMANGGTYVDGDLVQPYASRTSTGGSGGAYSPADATSIARFASFNGIVDFFASSTLVPYVMGNTRSGVLGLNAQYLENSGTQRAFESLMMHLLINRIREKTGETVDTLIHEQSLFREIAKEDFSGQRFDPVLGQKGWKGLSFVDNNVTLKYREDWLALPGVIWAYDTSLAGYFEQKELSAPPGYEGEHAVQDYPRSEIVATKMGNVMYKRPEMGGAVDDLIYDMLNLT